MRIYWWCSIGYYSNPNIASFAGEISNCSDCRISFSSTIKNCSKKQNQSNSKQSGVFLHPEKINHISCLALKSKANLNDFTFQTSETVSAILAQPQILKVNSDMVVHPFQQLFFAPAVFIPNCCYDAFTKDACTSTKKDGDYTADILFHISRLENSIQLKFSPVKFPRLMQKSKGAQVAPSPKVTRLSIPGPIQRCSEISLWVGTFHEIVSWKIFIPANTKTKINKTNKQTNKQTNKETNKHPCNWT